MAEVVAPIRPVISQESRPEHRRERGRSPIDCKIALTPLDQDGAPLFSETAAAFGRDLSQSGVCFAHDLPLSHSRYLLSFYSDEFGDFIVEAEVVWSRMNAIGSHESGCRIVRKIVAPQLFA